MQDEGLLLTDCSSIHCFYEDNHRCSVFVQGYGSSLQGNNKTMEIGKNCKENQACFGASGKCFKKYRNRGYYKIYLILEVYDEHKRRKKYC